MGWDDDSGYGDADDEVSQHGGPDVREQREEEQAEGDSGETGVDENRVLDVLGEGVEGVDADQHAGSDEGAGDAEDVGGGVETVADVDGDERAEASDDEHG